MQTQFAWLSRYPIFLPLLSYGLGIIFGVEFRADHFSTTFLFQLFLSILLTLSGFALITAWRAFSWNAAILLSFCFILGIVRMVSELPKPLPKAVAQAVQTKQEVALLVEVLEYCHSKPIAEKVMRHSFTVRALAYFQEAQAIPWDAKLRFSLEAEECPVAPGDQFRTLAKLKFPKRFNNPSSFDYPKFLQVQGISLVAYLKGPEWMVFLKRSKSWTLKLREYWFKSLKIGLPNQEARGFWEAFLLKEERFLTPQLEESFRRLGLSHLLVVSGLHLTLIFAFCFFPFYGLFHLWPSLTANGWAKRMAALIALGFTAIYTSILGFSASLGRAWWMNAALLWVLLAYGRVQLFSLLALVAWLLLLWEPGLLFQLSFQLSFAAVLALALFVERFSLWRKRKQQELVSPSRLKIWFVTTLGSTLAVQVVLWPWTALVFRQIPWGALLANLIFIPWFNLVLLPLGLVALLVSLSWPSAADLLWQVADFLSAKTLLVIQTVAQLPLVDWIPRPFLWSWVLYFGVLAYFFLPKEYLSRKIIFVWSAVLVLFFAGEIFFAAPARLQLIVFDVGQGESLLLELPNQEAILIDGGGFPGQDFDMGEKVVVPELLHRRITKLKAMVLTHPDADHLKGLEFLAKHFLVEEFWLPKVFANHPHVQPILESLKARRIPIRFLTQGDHGNWVEKEESLPLSWQVLWPPKLISPELISDNNQSLVLRICWQEVCFLLTGDIEAKTEQVMLATGLPLEAQVLKLGHHGSRTSSTDEFLQTVTAKYAVASLGKDHRFGFPHREVIQRLQKLGIKLFRTDVHGQIQISTDGKMVWVKK